MSEPVITTDSERTVRAQRLMGALLRIGVVASAIVLIVGGCFYFSQHGDTTVDYSKFRVEPGTLRSVSGVVEGLRTGDSLIIMQFGILILLATPVARVLFSLVLFLIERDWTYVVVTSIVLAGLAFSLFGADYLSSLTKSA
ncbi:hypothetical protein Pan216_56000 [Planctomycetes bacterium Pan216]|uniref:DUF1634 domain-containing protein n=1 Tax=Kolteria novifilia TaxID=2527975 RepID=A0A518BCM2_9BACT|nr:hypothetical protein Pan216_56000 [Planctomycetes bacterium Pan216]